MALLFALPPVVAKWDLEALQAATLVVKAVT